MCYKLGSIAVITRSPLVQGNGTLGPRRQMLLELLQDARRAGLEYVPPKLRQEFERSVFPDHILESSTAFLLRGHENVPEWKDGPPNPWRANQYVAGFLRGMLLLKGFDVRVRSHHGDPETIANVMAARVSIVAFWMPRQN